MLRLLSYVGMLSRCSRTIAAAHMLCCASGWSHCARRSCCSRAVAALIPLDGLTVGAAVTTVVVVAAVTYNYVLASLEQLPESSRYEALRKFHSTRLGDYVMEFSAARYPQLQTQQVTQTAPES